MIIITRADDWCEAEIFRKDYHFDWCADPIIYDEGQLKDIDALSISMCISSSITTFSQLMP